MARVIREGSELPVSESESLVGRAVEAAARAEWERSSVAQVVGEWETAPQSWRDEYRNRVFLHVEVALGVVADHCTTEADAIAVEMGTRTGVAFMRGDERIMALRAVAVECRGDAT